MIIMDRSSVANVYISINTYKSDSNKLCVMRVAIINYFGSGNYLYIIHLTLMHMYEYFEEYIYLF